MNTYSRANFSIRVPALNSVQVASMKSIRSSLVQIPSKDKNFIKGKTKSPEWNDWTGESSPLSRNQISSLKLPPLSLEVKHSSLPETHPTTEIFPSSKFRGSVILEPNFVPPSLEKKKSSHLDPMPEKPTNPKFRGSVVLEQNFSPLPLSSPKSKNKPDSDSEEEEEKHPPLMTRASIVIPESQRLFNSVSRCACKTQTGSVMFKKKKHNQDSWLIEQKIQGLKGQFLFSVCDGHGDKGHKVSNLIKKSILSHVEYSLSATIQPELQLGQIFLSGLKSMVSFVEASDLDLKYSGSTMVSVLIRGKTLICGNIGDSRAVIGQYSEGSWRAFDLSNDHKPSREDEARRVVQAGGVVRQYKMNNGEGVGPLRIWSVNVNNPGLAMTRSIGDFNAKTYGMIAEPEIVSHTIGKHDKFLIMATDGIWEFISSQEAVEIVKDVWKGGKSEACCDKLIEIAQQRWESENVVDDITALVAFFNSR